VPDSKAHQFNTAGTFYFQATYSGDNNNTGPVSSGCAAEPLTVSPNTPTISTTVSPAGPIKIGDSAHDTASLSGNTADAGGTVSYALYAHNDCSGLVADLTPTTNTVVNGSVPDSKAHQFNTAGTFYFQATYSGDNNNTGPVSSGCAAEPLTVSPNGPTISTTLSDASITVGDTIHDSSTLAGATSGAGGTVKYSYYASLENCNTGTFDNPGGTSAGEVTVSGGDVPNSDDATFNSAGTYYWRAYYSGDANNDPATSACTDETLRVIAPHITILKTPDTQTIVAGQTASFTIQVINDGNSPLTNVVVTDALAPGCARTSADIPGLALMKPAPDASGTITYSCTLANVTASFTNTAVATGKPELGPNVSSFDPAAVTVVAPVTHPAISI